MLIKGVSGRQEEKGCEGPGDIHGDNKITHADSHSFGISTVPYRRPDDSLDLAQEFFNSLLDRSGRTPRNLPWLQETPFSVVAVYSVVRLGHVVLTE